MQGTEVRRRLLVAALLAGLMAAMGLPAVAQQGLPAVAQRPLPRHVEGVVLVGYRPTASAAARAAARQSVAAIRASRLSPRALDAEKLQLAPGASVERAVKMLQRHPAVRVVEPDYVWTKTTTSNDPYYTDGSLWGMYGDATSPSNAFGSQAGEAWARGATGSRNIYIGVIDEGIQTTHLDLEANVWVNPDELVNGFDDDGNGYVDDVHGWDFYSNDASVYDGTDDDHGTHVAGTIGAEGGNGIGVAGVNWQVTLISAKFLGPNGGSTSGAIAAVDYINDLKFRKGLNIVATSNSWGGGGFSQLLLDAINRGGDQNILFIAAAGNSSANTDAGSYYPQGYSCTTATRSWDCVISVAATTSSGGLASFSNYGLNTVDLGAPGSGINSTLPGNSYGSYSGTSMATPHVSGAAALCASIDPTQSGFDLRNALLGTTAFTASLAGKTVTGGRLDAGSMIQLCQPPTGPVLGGPVSLTAQATGVKNVHLTWVDAAANENGFEVQSSAAGCQGFSTIGLVAPGSTSFDAAGLAASTEYCFQVRATSRFNGGSVSGWSNFALATTFDPPPPYVCNATTYDWEDTGGAPTLPLGDDSQTTVAIPFAFPFYGELFSSVNVSSNGYVRFGSGAATNFFNEPIPSNGEPNAFMAPLWDDLNPGVGGAVRTTTVGAAPQRRFVVSWEDVPHYSVAGSTLSFQLVLEEATGQAVFTYRDVVTGNASYDLGRTATVGMEDAEGVAGTQISYNQATLSDFSAYRCAVASSAPPPAPPPAPAALTATAASPTRVDLSWNDTIGETGYAVERSGDGTIFTSVATLAAGTTSYPDLTVAPNTTYWYRVSASNTAGTSVSSPVTVTTPDVPPAAPNIGGASVSGGTVTVLWFDNSGNETRFDIGMEKRSGNGGRWSALSVVGTAIRDATTFLHSPGKGTFRYRVRAVNNFGSSAWTGPSNVVVVTP